ncbi:ArsR family transcriptional regulator [Streptomyces sp. Root369]|uniref:ArsR family transcriptional regulator n=1 Tax=Streptomyces sp. Root369 TaxID=1736523 RepID=UPI000710084F|nr:ArsR family transcriptional regulator [Streptomyces sp. Root369]KQW10727.1 ArsR family transcriptional regulator [Streptomyces sp. Root369]
MSVPLYQAKADFFRMLGLLQDGPLSVRDLLTAIEVEPSVLSQQLAVLRRSGTVTSTREGSAVVKAGVLAGRNELPSELRGAEVVAR